MPREIVRRLRRAVTREVGRGGAHDARQIAKLVRDEVHVAQRADAQRQIGADVGEIDDAIGQCELELDLRIAREKLWHRGYQRVGPERGADVHAQPAARALAEAHHFRFRVGDGAHDAMRALEVDFAFGGEGEASRRAMEQAHAEAPLEPRHQLRHGRWRDAEIARGGREPVALDCAHERGHCQRRFHGPLSGRYIIAIMA